MATVYHITHLNNLASIGNIGLHSDDLRLTNQLSSTNIGYSHIKQRRLIHPVTVCQKGTIGQYVPFNFCPRSVMLYVVSRGLTEVENGQNDIIHLVSDSNYISTLRPCFFTDIHADLGYAEQCDDLSQIDNLLNWNAIESYYWSSCKEEKQAEFLVYNFVPWEAIVKIGVYNHDVKTKVEAIVSQFNHKPTVDIERTWYY